MSKAYDSALMFLARREHSLAELRQKLSQKGFAQNDINDALHQCIELGYQSEQRFAAAYARHRQGMGYGPRYIQLALRQKGVQADDIAKALAGLDVDWQEALQILWQRKFQPPVNLSEQRKQMQFLERRGFHPEAIRGLFV